MTAESAVESGGHYRGLRVLEGVVEKQPDRAAVWTFQETEAVGGSEAVSFNSRAEICTLGGQTYSSSTTSHFWLYLPNAEMTLDLEVNEVEVKVLTSLASVIWGTAHGMHAHEMHAH